MIPFFEVWIGFLAVKTRLELIIVTHGYVSSPWKIQIPKGELGSSHQLFFENVFYLFLFKSGED